MVVRVCEAHFCSYGDEESVHRECANEHLTTANQSEIRKAYLVSVDNSVDNVYNCSKYSDKYKIVIQFKTLCIIEL